MLVWWCLDKLDLDEIVRLHSGHVKGVDIFFDTFGKERGGSPARATCIENKRFSEVTFCDCLVPSAQCLCIVDIIARASLNLYHAYI